MSASKSKVIAVPIVAAIALGAYYGYEWYTQQHFVYAGNIDATRVDLPARLSTTVSSIAVQEGDAVHQDEALAALSCEDLLVDKKLADSNFTRTQKLFRSGNVSQEIFDNANNKKDGIDTRLSWCTIKSPISGSVITRYLEPGEWTSPGTKVLSIINLDDTYAYIYVPQEIMSQLHIGQKIKGKIPELSDKSLEGTIRKINDEAEFTPKNVQTRSERTRLVYGVKVALPNQDRKLKPGMTIEMEL